MTPTKQKVYLPVNGESEQCVCNDYTDWMERIESVVEQEGYFLTPEQLNEYTANVIKQALETAAEKAEPKIVTVTLPAKPLLKEATFNTADVDKQSITNTFEETFKLFEV